ncbi:MAG: hypothetical protein QW197_01485 [Candidatus Aenigmatarchaeota archaeon]
MEDSILEKIKIDKARGFNTEVKEFITKLLENLYISLSPEGKKILEENLEEIVLGTMPPYFSSDVGAYVPGEKAVYISSNVLFSRDPIQIAEVLFHELGHAILEEEILKHIPRAYENIFLHAIYSQRAADCLIVYAIGGHNIFNDNESYSLKRFCKKFKVVIEKIVINPEEFMRRNLEIIKEYEKRWNVQYSRNKTRI